MSLSINTTHHVFVLDCPDATRLAEFYAGLLGWQLDRTAADEGWVDVVPRESAGEGFRLAFQQVENYVPPVWPDGPIPQQGHLDFYVASLEESEPIALAAGATKHAVQPGADNGFTVYLDPAGHPFCLCEH